MSPADQQEAAQLLTTSTNLSSARMVLRQCIESGGLDQFEQQYIREMLDRLRAINEDVTGRFRDVSPMTEEVT